MSNELNNTIVQKCGASSHSASRPIRNKLEYNLSTTKYSCTCQCHLSKWQHNKDWDTYPTSIHLIITFRNRAWGRFQIPFRVLWMVFFVFRVIWNLLPPDISLVWLLIWRNVTPLSSNRLTRTVTVMINSFSLRRRRGERSASYVSKSRLFEDCDCQSSSTDGPRTVEGLVPRTTGYSLISTVENRTEEEVDSETIVFFNFYVLAICLVSFVSWELSFRFCERESRSMAPTVCTGLYKLSFGWRKFIPMRFVCNLSVIRRISKCDSSPNSLNQYRIVGVSYIYGLPSASDSLWVDVPKRFFLVYLSVQRLIS